LPRIEDTNTRAAEVPHVSSDDDQAVAVGCPAKIKPVIGVDRCASEPAIAATGR
jgi:hypothetical protein